MAMPTSAILLKRSGTRHVYRTTWTGWKKYQVDVADATDAENAAWSLGWEVSAGNGAVMTMMPSQVDVDIDYAPGKALITIYYEGVNMAAFPQNSATISVISSEVKLQWVEKESVTIEENDAIITVPIGGPLLNDASLGRVFYSIVEGSKVRPEAITTIALHTGIPRGSFSMDNIIALAGKVNVSIFLGADPGTMMLVGAQVPKYFVIGESTEVVPVTYILAYRAAGWGGMGTKVMKYRERLEYVALEADWDETTGEPTAWWDEYDSEVDDITFAKKVPVIRATPLWDTAKEAMVLEEDEATFATLKGLLSWAS